MVELVRPGNDERLDADPSWHWNQKECLWESAGGYRLLGHCLGWVPLSPAGVILSRTLLGLTDSLRCCREHAKKMLVRDCWQEMGNLSEGELDGRKVFVGQRLVDNTVHTVVQVEMLPGTTPPAWAWACIIWGDNVASVSLVARGYKRIELTEQDVTLDEAAACAARWVLSHLGKRKPHSEPPPSARLQAPTPKDPR